MAASAAGIEEEDHARLDKGGVGLCLFCREDGQAFWPASGADPAIMDTCRSWQRIGLAEHLGKTPIDESHAPGIAGLASGAGEEGIDLAAPVGAKRLLAYTDLARGLVDDLLRKA